MTDKPTLNPETERELKKLLFRLKENGLTTGKVSLDGEMIIDFNDADDVDGSYSYVSKIFKQFIAKVEQRARQEAVEEYKKSLYFPFDGLEIRMMYRDGDKVLQNRHVFSLKQIKLITEFDEVAQFEFSYMLKDLLEALSLQEEQDE